MAKNKRNTRTLNSAVLPRLFALLLCLSLLLPTALSARAESKSEIYTVAQVESLSDGIVAYNGAANGQDLIDRCLAPNAGVSAEFYAIALSQTGSYRFDSYEKAMLSYLDNHTVGSATSREKYALALSAAGSTNRYITDTANEAIGGLGIMSLVFGLHLLNNGYSSSLYSTDGLITEILSYRKSDGGWAVIGSYGDVDVTAMTLQALAPYYGRRSDVTAALDKALSLLSGKQLSTGGFKTMGAENSESTAQVIIALSSLGIDAQRDSRFIKNGVSVMGALMAYRCSDGGFSHTGGGSNATATEEAYCALIAYLRYCRGQSPLYVLDHADHSAPTERGTKNNGAQGGSSNNRSSKSGSSNNSGSQSNGSQSGSKNSGSQNQTKSQAGGTQKNNAPSHNSGASSNGSSSGGISNSTAQTDENGNRIVVIDGRRYIEATTPAGEVVTIAAEEADAAPLSSLSQPTHGGFQSDATADSAVKNAATADENKPGGGYKLWAILAILGAAGAACGILFLLKKRNKKNFIAVGIIAAAGVLFILLTNFQSTESYRQPQQPDGDSTITISIRCDTITGREKVNRYVPEDGEILGTTTCAISEGDTVYDVLLRATAEKNIPVDNRGADGAAYIAGINSLYEFDYGDLSGWMYRVNGAFPDVGCQSYTLSDGDVIEWVYTTNIGKDLSE